jgi:mRNA interferase MazF
MALAEQVETIDKTQLREHRGSIINTKAMDEITRALQIQIGAVEVYN